MPLHFTNDAWQGFPGHLDVEQADFALQQILEDLRFKLQPASIALAIVVNAGNKTGSSERAEVGRFRIAQLRGQSYFCHENYSTGEL